MIKENGMSNGISTRKSEKTAVIVFLIFILLMFFICLYPADHPEGIAGIPSENIVWILSCSGLVLLMTPGLSFFYGGMVKQKNIISTMLQSFVALGIISMIWYVVGFSLAFGDSIGGFIGDPRTFFMFDGVGTAAHPILGSSIPFVLFAAFQLKFAIITPALITGSFAERVRFWSYLIFISLWSLLIYCPLAHWTWHPEGFLAKWGVLDFAGGTVVHISAGIAAISGALFLGRRKSHVANHEHRATNIPYVILGTGLLWFGWFGFNAGSALAPSEAAINAFFNTNLASASAMLTWILIDTLKGRGASALGACIGAVVGLVAITPAAGFVSYQASIFIGVLASFVISYAVHIKSKSTLDDTLDVFPCHGIGGIVGMIATAIFAKTGGLITGDVTLFVFHLLALVIVIAFTFTGSWAIYKITDFISPLRVSADDEEAGLDISQHNESTFEVIPNEKEMFMNS
jgi:Amt family ammonium transporter